MTICQSRFSHHITVSNPEFDIHADQQGNYDVGIADDSGRVQINYLTRAELQELYRLLHSIFSINLVSQ